MEDLQELRKQIDQIDQEMVRLFEARMDVCRQVRNTRSPMERKCWTVPGNWKNWIRWEGWRTMILTGMGSGSFFSRLWP